jgi:hypothetical protein
MWRARSLLGAMLAILMAATWFVRWCHADSGTKEIRIADRTYRWPADKDSWLLNEAIPGVGASGGFSPPRWNEMLKSSVPGFTELPSGGVGLTVSVFRQTEHSEFQSISPDNGRPPVSYEVTPDGEEGDMRFWQPANWHTNNKPRLVTYIGANDMYVSCSRILARVTNCLLHWNDNGVIHSFGVFPIHLRYARAIVRAYASLVKN